jgi:hypothetical protein
MLIEVFEAVAETIFPFICEVELNSQGDPLLHPNIATVLTRIAEHGCEIKVQHNGTLLTKPIVELLCRQHGTIMLSLDAVGDKFDEVRRGGSWEGAKKGLTQLLAERDPKKLSVGVYPTLTRRTIGEVLRVLDWSAQQGVDFVTFHRYSPIVGSFEEAPSEGEYDVTRAVLRNWCAQNYDAVRVRFESERLNRKEPKSPRKEFASRKKVIAMAKYGSPTFPLEADNPLAISDLTCTAPRDYVEIGLEGQVSVCCRSQDVPLGYATSVESFAAVWLGENLRKVRTSLTRRATNHYPIPNCEECIKFFAPRTAGSRRSINYDDPIEAQNGLIISTDGGFVLDDIRKEMGQCNIALLPPGIDIVDLELWEDGRRLGPGNTLHDDIRQHGGGRYHIGTRSVYFSSSDGTDVQRNQRTYCLRSR